MGASVDRGRRECHGCAVTPVGQCLGVFYDGTSRGECRGTVSGKRLAFIAFTVMESAQCPSVPGGYHVRGSRGRGLCGVSVFEDPGPGRAGVLRLGGLRVHCRGGVCLTPHALCRVLADALRL